MIGGLPHGPQNMNRCQERGMPRIPVLSSMGGDEAPKPQVTTGANNPYPGWSLKVLKDISESNLRRVRLWDQEEDRDDEDKVAGVGTTAASLLGKEGEKCDPAQDPGPPVVPPGVPPAESADNCHNQANQQPGTEVSTTPFPPNHSYSTSCQQHPPHLQVRMSWVGRRGRVRILTQS